MTIVDVSLFVVPVELVMGAAAVVGVVVVVVVVVVVGAEEGVTVSLTVKAVVAVVVVVVVEAVVGLLGDRPNGGEDSYRARACNCKKFAGVKVVKESKLKKRIQD